MSVREGRRGPDHPHQPEGRPHRVPARRRGLQPDLERLGNRIAHLCRQELPREASSRTTSAGRTTPSGGATCSASSTASGSVGGGRSSVAARWRRRPTRSAVSATAGGPMDMGSRFNIRFERAVPAGAATPDGVMEILSPWVDFAGLPGGEVYSRRRTDRPDPDAREDQARTRPAGRDVTVGGGGASWAPLSAKRAEPRATCTKRWPSFTMAGGGWSSSSSTASWCSSRS